MKLFQKTIFTGFMPNLLTKEVSLVLKFLYPWNWSRLQTGKFGVDLQEQIQKFFCIDYAILFDSGRSSLQMALNALQIQTGDEVLLQAYTCSVVSNAVIWAKATPIYIDVREDFNMDPQDLEKKITARSKVLIIQHTFGIPADLDALLAIAKKHNLTVIEDCAHVIGGTYKEKFLGTFGDIAVLSFGSDKAISCGRGGALITSNHHLAATLKYEQSQLPLVPKIKIIQQLYTYILFFISKPVYHFGIGKLLLFLSKQLRLSSRIIEQDEKKGKPIKYYPAKLPNALAVLALHQIMSIGTLNLKRKTFCEIYVESITNPQIKFLKSFQDYPLLRFPILVNNPYKLQNMAAKEGILLGDWYNRVVAPKDVDMHTTGYILGTCPVAEKLATQSLNLPTAFSIRSPQMKKIIKFINSYAE